MCYFYYGEVLGFLGNRELRDFDCVLNFDFEINFIINRLVRFFFYLCLFLKMLYPIIIGFSDPRVLWYYNIALNILFEQI